MKIDSKHLRQVKRVSMEGWQPFATELLNENNVLFYSCSDLQTSLLSMFYLLCQSFSFP